MSWFSGGLSQFSSLTDQITTFTKEVLTESTQEIEDPVTELQLAKRKIEELTEQNSQYNLELERLRKRNEEFSERAETAEFQVASINQEYRKLLQQRDDELKKLREQCIEMKDQQRKIVMAKSDSNLPSLAKNIYEEHNLLKPVKPVHSFGAVSSGEGDMDLSRGHETDFAWMEGWGEEADFDMSGLQISQSQVTQLQSEVACVTVECQHWKELAQQRTQGTVGIEHNMTDSVSLREQLEELQKHLQQERQHHEHEVSALQSLHVQQMEALSERHQKEMENLKEPKDQVDSNDDLAQQVTAELNDINQKLMVKNEELSTKLSTLGVKNKKLLEKLHTSQIVISELRHAIDSLKHVVRTTQDNQLKHMESEKEVLSTYIQDVQVSFQTHQVTIDALQTQRNKFEEETKCLTTKVDQLNLELKTKELEIEQLTQDTSCEEDSVNRTTTTQTNRMPQVSSERLFSEDQMKYPDTGEYGAEDDTPGNQLERLQQKLEKEEIKREQLKTHLAQLMSEHDQELREVILSKEEMETKLSELESCLAASNQEKDKLTVANHQIVEELSQLKMTLARVQKEPFVSQENQILCEQLEEGRRTIEQLKLELSVACEKAITSESQVQIYQKDLKDKLTEIQEKKIEIDNMVSLLKTKDSQLHTQQEQIEDLVKKIEDLSQEVQQSQSQFTEERESLTHQLSEVEKKHLKEREELTKELERQKTRYNTQLEQAVLTEDLSGKLKQMETQLQAKDLEIAKTSQEYKKLASSLEASTQHATSLNDKLTKLTYQLQSQADQMSMLTKERDSLLDALQKKEAESRVVADSKAKEVARLQEMETQHQMECEKYQKELERLRGHLVQVEEQYTQEALQADHRETQLRQQIRLLEEGAARNKTVDIQQNYQTQQLMSQIQTQLEHVTAERDQAWSELSRVREEAEQNATALQNLQNVLEHFQRDQTAEVSMSLLQKQKELELATRQYEKLQEKQRQSEAALYNASVADETIKILQLESQQKDKMITDLTSELEKYQMTLNKTKIKIEEMSSEEDNRVDKSLVKNLFLTYLSSQDKRKKDDIAQLIGKILEIPPKELNKTLESQSGWFPRFWSSPAPPLSPSVIATPTTEQRSLSQIFVSFLETESAKPIQPKAPPLKPPVSHPSLPSHIVPYQTPPTAPTKTSTPDNTMTAALDTPPIQDTVTNLERLLNNT